MNEIKNLSFLSLSPNVVLVKSCLIKYKEIAEILGLEELLQTTFILCMNNQGPRRESHFVILP